MGIPMRFKYSHLSFLSISNNDCLGAPLLYFSSPLYCTKQIVPHRCWEEGSSPRPSSHWWLFGNLGVTRVCCLDIIQVRFE